MSLDGATRSKNGFGLNSWRRRQKKKDVIEIAAEIRRLHVLRYWFASWKRQEDG